MVNSCHETHNIVEGFHICVSPFVFRLLMPIRNKINLKSVETNSFITFCSILDLKEKRLFEEA